ncbi:MAG TPA: hypothetical protein VGB38_07270 [bacterium]
MANALAVAGPNSRFQGKGVKPAGFWAGLWHGIISPVTFIVSLFNPKVRLDEVKNNGKWYDFGFILGVIIIFGESGSRVN